MKKELEFFDTHSHYNDEKFDNDRNELIQLTYDEGITKFVCAGYDLQSSKVGLKISREYDYIYTISGISPNDVKKSWEETAKEIAKLEELIKKEIELANKENKKARILAVGEIGLDYYWNVENKNIQIKAFEAQIDIANRYSLPIVIHTREAIMDTIDILKNKRRAKKTGIFHCCPLNRELVKEALRMGFYISFAGPVTFKNSKNAKEIVQMVPMEKILIETDSPYLAPEPKRGTRNDSRNIKIIAEKIAEYKQISIGQVADQTYKNAMRIFKIDYKD